MLHLSLFYHKWKERYFRAHKTTQTVNHFNYFTKNQIVTKFLARKLKYLTNSSFFSKGNPGILSDHISLL